MENNWYTQTMENDAVWTRTCSECGGKWVVGDKREIHYFGCSNYKSHCIIIYPEDDEGEK